MLAAMLMAVQDIGLGPDCQNLHCSFATVPALKQIAYYSPQLGVQHYRFCNHRQAWVGADDDHFLVELFTRDLVNYCKGLPAF